MIFQMPYGIAWAGSGIAGNRNPPRKFPQKELADCSVFPILSRPYGKDFLA